MVLDTKTLASHAQALNVNLTALQVEQLNGYAELLTKWNKSFNFVSRQDIGRLQSRHILDSLAGLPLLRGDVVMDLGSGAGLPGMPLAIASPERQFFLCDRSERRCRFLKQVTQSLTLPNIEVWTGDFGTDAFDAAGNRDHLFSTIVCRGVATAQQVWDMVQPQLEARGRVLLYERTHVEDQEQQATPAEDLDGVLSKHAYQVPGLNQTHQILCMERS